MVFNNNGFGRRVEDLQQIFDKRWEVNKRMVNQALKEKKNSFNRMNGIVDKNVQRSELMYQNSVEGQVNSLNERMSSMNEINKMNRMNDVKRGFK